MAADPADAGAVADPQQPPAASPRQPPAASPRQPPAASLTPTPQLPRVVRGFAGFDPRCDPAVRFVSAGTLIPVRAEPRGLGATIAVVSESARAAANACVVWYTVPRESVPRLHAYLRRALDDAAEDETSDPTDEGSNPADERDAADEADARFGDPPPLRYRTALVDAGSLWIDPAGVARWNASRGRSSDRVALHRHAQRAGEHLVIDHGAVRWGIVLGACWLTSAPYAFARGWCARAREVDAAYRRLELAGPPPGKLGDGAEYGERHPTGVPAVMGRDASKKRKKLFSPETIKNAAAEKKAKAEAEKKAKATAEAKAERGGGGGGGGGGGESPKDAADAADDETTAARAAAARSFAAAIIAEDETAANGDGERGWIGAATRVSWRG